MKINKPRNKTTTGIFTQFRERRKWCGLHPSFNQRLRDLSQVLWITVHISDLSSERSCVVRFKTPFKNGILLRWRPKKKAFQKTSWHNFTSCCLLTYRSTKKNKKYAYSSDSHKIDDDDNVLDTDALASVQKCAEARSEFETLNRWSKSWHLNPLPFPPPPPPH